VTALLEVERLGRTFHAWRGLRRRSVVAVEDVSFSLGRGEAVALVGESGSGKSTTGRMIARLVEPTAGAIRLDGEDALARRPSLALRRRVQMIFQDPFASLNAVHTVRHHLARPLLRHGRVEGRGAALERAVADLLGSVGLAPHLADRHPHQLSGGQRQRVAIARALAVGPELIVADEPTSMLDVSLRAGVLSLLDELKTRRGLAFVFITHDLASAARFADSVLVLRQGRVIESGPARTVLGTPMHPYTRLLLAAAPRGR
jgi:ABC-type glutathione transport system ATPase component